MKDIKKVCFKKKTEEESFNPSFKKTKGNRREFM